jgi:hypothetical protein
VGRRQQFVVTVDRLKPAALSTIVDANECIQHIVPTV